MMYDTLGTKALLVVAAVVLYQLLRMQHAIAVLANRFVVYLLSHIEFVIVPTLLLH